MDRVPDPTNGGPAFRQRIAICIAILTGLGLVAPDLAGRSLPAQGPPGPDLVAERLELIDATGDPVACAAGDFDADGDVDAVLAGTDLVWRANDGQGGWLPGERPIGLPDAGLGPTPRVADLDGDGDPDLIAAAPAPVGFRLFVNDGTGRFTDGTPGVPGLADPVGRALTVDDPTGGPPRVLLPTGAGLRVLRWTGVAFVDVSAATFPQGVPSASAVAATDLDGDGVPDLVVADGLAGPDDRVFLARGGGFVPGAFTGLRRGTGPATDVAAADLDGDGAVDLLVVDGRGAVVALRVGANAFVELPVPLDGDAVDAVVADVDGDGDPDIVTVVPGRGPSIWRNDGAAGLVRETRAPLAPPRGDGRALAVANVDGRHGLDLLFTRHVTELWLAAPSGGYVRAAGPELDAPLEIRPHDAADVDGDGDLDVVGVRDGPAGAEMLLGSNDGTGRFAWSALAPGAVAGRLVFVDVDRDGDPDLLGAVGGAIGAPFPQPDLLLINDGAGGFTDESATRLPRLREGTNRLAVGDVDGDGDDDAILVGTRPVLYRNDGTGHFVDAGSVLPGGALIATDGAFADLDGDGDLDFVIAYYDPFFGSVFVWKNDGTGRFVDDPAALPAGFVARAREVELGDVDGDGDVDIAFGNVGAPDEVLANDGTGRFASGVPLPGAAAGSTFDARLFDVDGDGDLDWLGARRAWRLALNDGAGTFRVGDLPAFVSGRRLVVADLDTDGDLDVLGPFDRLSGTVRHLAVPRPPRTSADLVVRLFARAATPTPALALLSVDGLGPPVVLPGIGTLRLPLGRTLPLPAVTLPAGGGSVDVVCPLPSDPRLAGLHLGFQAGYLSPTGIALGNAVARSVVF